MTLRATSLLGLLLFLLLCLAYAILTFWENRVLADAGARISLVHNRQYVLNVEATQRLQAAELVFEIYRRKDQVDIDLVTHLMRNITIAAQGVEQAVNPETDSLPIHDSLNRISRSSRVARTSWLEALDIFALEEDLTSDTFKELMELVVSSLTSVKREISDLQIALYRSKDNSITSDLVDRLKNLDSKITTVEAEVHEFLGQELVGLSDLMLEVSALERALREQQRTDEHIYDDAVAHILDHVSELSLLVGDLAEGESLGDDELRDDEMLLITSNIKQIEHLLFEHIESSVDEAVLAVDNMHTDLNNFRRARQGFVTVGILIAILTFASVSFVIRRQSMNICRGTQRLAGGDWAYRLPVVGRDRFGQISMAFNAMAQQVQQHERQRHQFIEDLRESKVQAEQANVAKSEFLATMSHEIRTPINGVLGAADLLQRESLDRSQHHLVDTIVRSGTSLLGIINDILDFSKIESGRLNLELRTDNLHRLVEDVAEMAAPSAHKKGLDIHCLIDPFVPQCVEVDSLRLTQVLTNLVGNAVKFTEQGEIVIRVVRTDSEGVNDKLTFEVTDTGIGIGPQALDSIFDVFTQAEQSTTRRFGGSGLGLAITRSLVDMMGGEISVESETGKGSRFRFSLQLPAMRSEQNNGLKALSDSLQQREPLAMIVSDNDHTIESLSNFLMPMQIHVRCVDTGKQAMAMVQELLGRHPDSEGTQLVAFVDNQLADMSGADLLSRLRSLEDAEALTRVALCLVNDDPRKLDWRSALGIRHKLVKPVRQSALYNTLIEIMGSEEIALVDDSVESSLNPLNATIMLAEDHVINQDIIVRMLENMGCEVTLAVNGLEAAQLAKHQHYDAILMDCDMPQVDGFEATQEIRDFEASIGRESRQIIIALTANALQGDRERCLAAGMDDFLTKPVNMQQLHAVLSQWLASDPAQPETEVVAVKGEQDHKHEESAGEEILIDMQTVENLIALEENPGSYEFLDTVVQEFIRSWHKDYALLQEALEATNLDEARKLAHRIKSSGRSVGARQLANRCGDVETSCRRNQKPDVALVLSELPLLFDRTIAGYEALMQRAA